MNLSGKTILLTGGTGSFGKVFIATLLKNKFKGVIRVFSRDEFKQHELSKKYPGEKRIRFLIGDIRDTARLSRAMHGVDLVVHAAALKHVPILEYNPFEAIKTNILGSQNVVDCSIEQEVKKVILVSSDKAVSPVNLYGATKMVAEKLFVQANSYSGGIRPIFSVARYGNVMGSRGSVMHLFLAQAKDKVLTVTDERMTRFWITLDEGVRFVIRCLESMAGGEIFVPKMPSIKVMDLAKAISADAKIKFSGIRPGEKIHEALVSEDEARHAKEYKDYFVIEPEFDWWGSKIRTRKGKKLKSGFTYTSSNNTYWLTVEKIRNLIEQFKSNE